MPQPDRRPFRPGHGIHDTVIVASALSVALVRDLWKQAREGHRRRVLLLDGEADWTLAGARLAVAALPELTARCWLSERPLAHAEPAVRSPRREWSHPSSPSGSLRFQPLRAAFRLLGQELELLVYDAHSGFDPDGFGAATGALRGGGILILLTPPLADWPHRSDPQAARIAVWPYAAEALTGRFIARLVRVLRADPLLVAVHQDAAELPATARFALPETGRSSAFASGRPIVLPADPVTSDQRSAVAAILETARGRARRPLVLTAHRGRGKSAALGLAAGQLLGAGVERILVTAPSRAAVAAVFLHAAAILREIAHPAAAARLDNLIFRSPDALVATLPDAALLLVDEAAGIPASRLEKLLIHYPRSVFATTVHGYEGTGRGFEIRFRATLERLTPHWRALTLATPIRWALDDPLETLTFRALLLAAAPAAEASLRAANLANCRCERLAPDALAQDESTLEELFGLLVLAHYQTRPMDLRMLLDGPNVRLYVLRHGAHIAATLLAAAEGGIADAGLREAIYLGQRRPHGHLLPQTLSAHAGLATAPAYRYLRVIRIAVHPALAGRGLGRMLLRALFRDGRAEGFDLAGASFGATPELLRFWARCGYWPVQTGVSRNAASGEHAVVMLRRLSGRGWHFAAMARQRYAARLPTLLAGPLRALAPEVAVALIRALPVAPETQPAHSLENRSLEDLAACRELAGFVTGYRTLDATLPLLAELTRRQLGRCLRSGALLPDEAGLLVAAACQLRPLAELVQHFRFAGRAACLAELRRAAGRLTGERNCRQPPPPPPPPPPKHGANRMSYPTVENCVGNTPLVRLQRLPGHADNLILAKLEGNNPAGSVKDRPALNMIRRAEERGTIEPGATLIEATSGNTGIALAMAAAIRGYRMRLVMPEHMSAERRGAMKSFGAEIVLTPREGGMEAAIDLACAMEARGEGIRLDQFSNPDNPAAHYETTGPEIWRDTAGQVTHFVSAMGTTGTIMGTGRYLKEQNPAIRIVGVQPEEGASIPGIRRWPEAYLPRIYDPAGVDRIVDVSQTLAERTARELAAKEGIFAGISSGGAIAAALRLSTEVNGATIVVIVCDRGDRYLSTGVF